MRTPAASRIHRIDKRAVADTASTELDTVLRLSLLHQSISALRSALESIDTEVVSIANGLQKVRA